jgi:hypothetical protein
VTGPKRPLKISVHVECTDGDSEVLDVPVDGDGVQMQLARDTTSSGTAFWSFRLPPAFASGASSGVPR